MFSLCSERYINPSAWRHNCEQVRGRQLVEGYARSRGALRACTRTRVLEVTHMEQKGFLEGASEARRTWSTKHSTARTVRLVRDGNKTGTKAYLHKPYS